MSTPQTYDQKMAATAFSAVKARPPSDEYRSFAKSFPGLIHTCGLMQAAAFALADDKKKSVLEDTVKVLAALTGEPLGTDKYVEKWRGADALEYIRASRFALRAASWIKRQADALIPAPQDQREEV
ncbi:MAG: type III-B CRISPR module-associated protein Cmr5 [Planctomycetota bacterium]|jgi:CRISPR-associated protein Cmr5|nr:type III-B CRISPR module-associated protein Cmr5 [Planctomycetota bacterium]